MKRAEILVGKNQHYNLAVLSDFPFKVRNIITRAYVPDIQAIFDIPLLKQVIILSTQSDM